MVQLVRMNEKKKLLPVFAAHLTALRKQQGISIRELSSRASLEYSQVQRIEKAKVNFSFTTLLALADGLGLHPSALLQGLNIPQ